MHFTGHSMSLCNIYLWKFIYLHIRLCALIVCKPSLRAAVDLPASRQAAPRAARWVAPSSCAPSWWARRAAGAGGGRAGWGGRGGRGGRAAPGRGATGGRRGGRPARPRPPRRDPPPAVG